MYIRTNFKDTKMTDHILKIPRPFFDVAWVKNDVKVVTEFPCLSKHPGFITFESCDNNNAFNPISSLLNTTPFPGPRTAFLLYPLTSYFMEFQRRKSIEIFSANHSRVFSAQPIRIVGLS